MNGTKSEKAQRADVVGGSFNAILADHNGGRTEFEASQRLQDLVQAIRDTGSAGILTLKMTLTPVKGDASKVISVIEITTKEPREAASAFFFTTEEGRLQKRDPRQLEHKALIPDGQD